MLESGHLCPPALCRHNQVGTNGVVKDPVVHQQCIDKIVAGAFDPETARLNCFAFPSACGPCYACA